MLSAPQPKEVCSVQTNRQAVVSLEKDYSVLCSGFEYFEYLFILMQFFFLVAVTTKVVMGRH